MAAEQAADLVAMGTHGRSGVHRLLLGSVAEGLLRSSPVPLLLVRPEEAAATAAEEGEAITAVGRRRERLATSPALWERRAHELMVQPVVVAREETPLVEVVSAMLDHRIGSVPVVDQRGQLVGIITESDFVGDDRCIPLAAYQVPQLFRERVSEEALAQVYHAGRALTAGQIMTRPVVAVEEDEPVSAVVRLLLERGINQVPVVRDGMPVGIVARRDLLRLLVPPQAANRTEAMTNATGG